ncbi:hypothetical protein C8R45DRAFT_947574 [Mycena sanguinolenta]|nr:hypothetical protein C8R45DRAFT_947574 [Mycena sanguinolenta]
MSNDFTLVLTLPVLGRKFGHGGVNSEWPIEIEKTESHMGLSVGVGASKGALYQWVDRADVATDPWLVVYKINPNEQLILSLLQLLILHAPASIATASTLPCLCSLVISLAGSPDEAFILIQTIKSINLDNLKHQLTCWEPHLMNNISYAYPNPKMVAQYISVESSVKPLPTMSRCQCRSRIPLKQWMEQVLYLHNAVWLSSQEKGGICAQHILMLEASHHSPTPAASLESGC